MSEKLVRGYVTIGLMVYVDEPDDDSATLKVEHMFERGELHGKILHSVVEGDMTLEIDEVEDVED